MPIYEYYCPDNHTVYQFFAKTLAQGRSIPACPDNPRFRMVKRPSSFAISTGAAKEDPPTSGGNGETGAEDAQMEAAMGTMEREFAHVDENDPKAMARMMRRMAELTGEKIDGEAEEMVRKLEEGADPETLDDALGTSEEGGESDSGDTATAESPLQEVRRRLKVRRAPRVDPKLYDYE